MIILEDADIGAAAAQAVSGIAMLSGQACAAPTRIFVHNNKRRSFERLLRGFMRRLRVGDPFDPKSDMGPLISQESRQSILNQVNACLGGGAVLLDPAMEQPLETDDACLRPIVLSNVLASSDLAQRELFGPVQCIWGFDAIAEVVELANNSKYALTAYLHGGNAEQCRMAAQELTAGSVWINGVLPLPAQMPFGGAGASGSGRLGGIEGIRQFTRTKSYIQTATQ